MHGAGISRGITIASGQLSRAVLAYRMRWKRRRLLYRSWRKRRQLSLVIDRTDRIHPNAILSFTTLRNEIARLPFFLDHYRALGVEHFIVVDNDSDDGSAEFLAQQPDVSVWHTSHSYRLSRFGVDWLTWLQMTYAHDHWTLTVDVDELLIYPDWDKRKLPDLTAWLDARHQPMMGAMMLDMYPKGAVGSAKYTPGTDPTRALNWFDAYGYWVQRQPRMDSLWLQGGVRARCFFQSEPERAPTLNKVPLVRWNKRYAYVSSAHSMLPPRLNHIYDENGQEKVTGVLLHTKFLDQIVAKSSEEKQRQEHFANSSLYDAYYDALADNPILWDESSIAYQNWEQLVDLGLMSKGEWA